MRLKKTVRYLSFVALFISSLVSFGQNVPMGIYYQAVARDNTGKELVNKVIDVKFSILPGDPLAAPVYQELHSKVTTTPYGVFSLMIGKGTPVGSSGELANVNWGSSFHWLRVEVKFDNTFINMGEMQFLSVPYALYAQKSLEPGPAGPKGDPGPKGAPGDPATDKQTISFDQSTLSISGGNSVPLTSLLQNLTITNSPEGNYLGISRGNSVLLSNFEGDGDPKNEIQDLVINSDVLKITNNTNATSWSLAKYLQSLTWDPLTSKLGITDSPGTIDLSVLKNDADASPTNEIQSLAYDKGNGNISISGGNTVNISNTVGFKAKKTITQTGLTIGNTYPFINSEAEFIENSCYDTGSGTFTATSTGIYTFYITYKADGAGSGRVLTMLKNGSVYEILGPDISSGSELSKWVVMKLDQGNTVSLTINTGMSNYSGTGSFLGYRVN